MPPRKKTVEENVPNVDEILNLDTVAEEAKSDEKTQEEVPVTENTELTPEQKRIKELEAQLAEAEERARTNPTDDNGRPLPETALTSEQKRIRALEDRVARANAKAFEANGVRAEDSEDGVLIHFVADGFTAQGKTFYRGQTVRFGPRAYEQTKDRHGNSWLDLPTSEQYRKYGQEFFRPGPWPGEDYDDPEAAEKAKKAQINAPVISI